jgi:transposase
MKSYNISRKIAERLGVTKRTVQKVLQKHDTLGCVKDRPGRGRKRKLLEMETKKIVKKARAGKPATDIARQHFFDTGQTTRRPSGMFSMTRDWHA